MDELGFSLLMLSSARGTSSSGSGNGTVVLQMVLSVFGALLSSLGPCLRILAECFVRQVYLKALVQTFGVFSEQVQLLSEGVEVVSPFFRVASSSTAASSSSSPLPSAAGAGNASVEAAAASSSASSSAFRLDELEVVFESLSDLLSDRALLPALFVSFDCNPTSTDLAQPLVQYISRCAW